MNGNLIKLGLLGAVGFYIYEMYYKPKSVDPKQVPNTGMPNNPINNIAVMASPVSDLKTEIAIAAGMIDGLNWYQWNYYYQKITGQNVTVPAGIDPNTIVSLNNFWAGVVPKGLSGTGIYSNMYESYLPGMRYM